jgi:hypothetical protein
MKIDHFWIFVPVVPICFVFRDVAASGISGGIDDHDGPKK